MPMINNENVNVNDRIYDITHGYGTVVDTAFGDIVVRFDSGIRITFDSTGSYSGVRRLYWHSPVVVEPPKNKDYWNTLVSCILAIHSHIKK